MHFRYAALVARASRERKRCAGIGNCSSPAQEFRAHAALLCPKGGEDYGRSSKYGQKGSNKGISQYFIKAGSSDY